MKTPSKFVALLNEEQINNLKNILKHSEQPRIRQRAHAILLSSKAFSLDEIATILEVNRDTVSNWLNKWEQCGLSGLTDQPRPGRPSSLTPLEKQLVMELCQENPRSVLSQRAALVEQTGKKVSQATIKRILTAAKFT
ncbi:MAG: helix-turn-helix domain containing protein [Thioploca sp.]|nr:helix-turn-helix domain containing protein [Thioploca sp.]